MKCHILFSGKNKKNIINLSSAENAQRVVKVKSGFGDFELIFKVRIYQSTSHLRCDGGGGVGGISTYITNIVVVVIIVIIIISSSSSSITTMIY